MGKRLKLRHLYRLRKMTKSVSRKKSTMPLSKKKRKKKRPKSAKKLPKNKRLLKSNGFWTEFSS